MDFNLSPEQEILGDVARRFVAAHYSFEQRQTILRSPSGWSRDVWRKLSDLGLTALVAPVDAGGAGAGPVDTMVVMDALGGAMLLEPFWASAVLATLVLRGVGGQAANHLVERLATGQCIATVAHSEPGSRYDDLVVERVRTRAMKRAKGWLIRGEKSIVLHGDAADVLLVSAQPPGGELALFAVPREATGLTASCYRTIDGRGAADVHLSDVLLGDDALLGVGASAIRALDEAHDAALAALCADALGAMKALFEETRAHLLTRRQFGEPLGKFQALRHRMADMLLFYEQARSMTILAALKSRSAEVDERRRALSAAKVVVGQAGRFIGQQAVQLHGGMGMSDEFRVSHLFKRLMAAELLLGDTDHHVHRFIALDPHEMELGLAPPVTQNETTPRV